MGYKEADIDSKWSRLTVELKANFGKQPDTKGILFLIGINELGHGPKDFSKEEKQDLIHIGNCKVLSRSGYYELEGLDEEGWPHWKQLNKIPQMSTAEQEQFIKWHILEYFDNI